MMKKQHRLFRFAMMLAIAGACGSPRVTSDAAVGSAAGSAVGSGSAISHPKFGYIITPPFGGGGGGGGGVGPGTNNSLMMFSGTSSAVNAPIMYDGTGRLSTAARIVAQALSIAPVNLVGALPFGVELDNWSPSGLSTHGVAVVQASDNWGTLITGIDASWASVGDRITICNFDVPIDAGIVELSAEDSHSLAANRIALPGTNGLTRTINESHWKIDPQSCRSLVYMYDEAADLTVKRWFLDGAQSHIERAVIQSLQFYPDNTPAALTSGSTYNDYAPVDLCPQIPGPSGGLCESGGSTLATDYTVYTLQTTTSSVATIGGLEYDDVSHANGTGPVKLLFNLGPGGIVLKHLSAANANAQDQIDFASGQDTTLAPGEAMLLYHQTHTNYWHPIGRWIVGSCGAGNAITSINADGSVTCSAFPTGSGTATHIALWSSSTGIAAGNATEASNLYTFGGGASVNETTGAITGTTITGTTISGSSVTSSGNLSGQQHFDPGRLVPAAFTSGASTNDWNPTNLHSFEHVVTLTSSSTAATLTGMNAGSDGEYKELCNFGTGEVDITNEDSGSLAANRFWTYRGRTIPIRASASQPQGCATFRYTTNNSRWVEISGPQFVNGTITLSGGTGTATVFSGASCICTDSTAAAAVKCAVSSTTLTATGTSTDVITYLCM